MKACECEFEAEVLAAAMQSHWSDELRAHVAGCAICSDVAAVAEAIEAGRDAAPSIPDSGRVWWLAQRRAKLEAAAAADRPMLAAQVIALACIAGLLVGYLPGMAAWFQSTWLLSASKLLAEHGVLALAMAAVLFLLPAAVYFAMGRE
jgi:hypothetical protein